MAEDITRTRFGYFDQDNGVGSITGYVLWGHNHLNQRRQFAFDGVKWFYQATTREMFRVVSESDVPEPVKARMREFLRPDYYAIQQEDGVGEDRVAEVRLNFDANHKDWRARPFHKMKLGTQEFTISPQQLAELGALFIALAVTTAPAKCSRYVDYSSVPELLDGFGISHAEALDAMSMAQLALVDAMPG